MPRTSPTRAQQSPGQEVLAGLCSQPPFPPAQRVCPFPRLTVQESTRAQKKETSQHKSHCKNAEISSLRIRVRGLDYYYYHHFFFKTFSYQAIKTTHSNCPPHQRCTARAGLWEMLLLLQEHPCRCCPFPPAFPPLGNETRPALFAAITPLSPIKVYLYIYIYISIF